MLQVFDNEDGTLSLFGTILDHVGGVAAPAPGTAAAGLTPTNLASIGRTLSYNDDQTGARSCKVNPCGEGLADDRNVELLIDDPRPGKEPEPEVPGPVNRGGGGGANPPATPPVVTPPSTRPPTKAKKCKKGFRKVKAKNGKTKCVKKKKKAKKGKGKTGR